MIVQGDCDEQALLHAAAGGSEVRELVQGCLERDIDLRLTIEGALRSGWFDGCTDGGEEENASIWR